MRANNYLQRCEHLTCMFSMNVCIYLSIRLSIYLPIPSIYKYRYLSIDIDKYRYFQHRSAWASDRLLQPGPRRSRLPWGWKTRRSPGRRGRCADDATPRRDGRAICTSDLQFIYSLNSKFQNILYMYIKFTTESTSPISVHNQIAML